MNMCHNNLTLWTSDINTENVFNQDLFFKKTVKYVGEPMVTWNLLLLLLSITQRGNERLFSKTACSHWIDKGVRREVGKHARVLKKLQSSSRTSEEGNELKKSKEIIEKESAPPPIERIGHTEVEVIAGALFGFFVSVGVYTLM